MFTKSRQKPQKASISTRMTDSQERILTLLKQIDREISAQDLYIELRRQNQSLGLTTVYRTLKTLKLKGVVQTRSLSRGESLYSLAQTQQHYLTCLGCGQSIPIEDCPICEKKAQLNQSQNFKIYYHTLEFFGLCPSCRHQLEIGVEIRA